MLSETLRSWEIRKAHWRLQRLLRLGSLYASSEPSQHLETGIKSDANSLYLNHAKSRIFSSNLLPIIFSLCVYRVHLVPDAPLV